MVQALQLVERKVQVPSSRILATIEPTTLDKNARTFEVVFSSGALFTRYDWMREQVYEAQLEVSPQACDLSRLNSGKSPFLLDHNAWSVKGGGAGVIESARIQGTQAIARIRLSKRPELDPILLDIQDGILCQVSVGTDVLEWKEITATGADRRRFLATKWKPYECSLVLVGADEGAVVLSHDQTPAKTHRCSVFFSKDAMDPTQLETEALSTTSTSASASATATPPATPTRTAKAGGAAAPALPDAEQLRAQAAADERSRIAAIQKAGLKLHVPAATIQKLVDDGASIELARERLIEAAAARDDAGGERGGVQILRDETDGLRLSMENYLAHRIDARNKLDERSKDFVGLSLLDLARVCLDKRSVRHKGLPKSEIVQLALASTSDFPELLANTAKKTLRQFYDAYPSRWRDLVRVVPAADFKQMSSISIGDSPKLLKVAEHGEFQRGKLVESAEKYSLETYGRVLGFTRQAIVNDDLGALQRIGEILGNGAAALVADIVFAILVDNANMSDSVALFHATHGNLGDKVLGLAGLDQMRTAMRRQTGPNGQKLNITAANVVVPPELETVARQLLVLEIVPTATTNANPYRGLLQPIVEPRLSSAIVWFAAANPGQMDTIQASFLEGEGEGPMIETRQGFDVDGVEIKARLDFAAKATEFRGLYKSSGTV